MIVTFPPSAALNVPLDNAEQTIEPTSVEGRLEIDDVREGSVSDFSSACFLAGGG